MAAKQRNPLPGWSHGRGATVFLLLLFSPVLAHGQSVGQADDAYHYAEFAGAPHAGNYTEWWYFNFYDAEQNVQGIFSYFVTDPANLTGFGQSQMAAVAYGPGGIVTELDQYPVTDFSASSDRANVQVAANSVQAITGGLYSITGQSSDGRLQWNLLYASQLSPWFAASGISVGNLSWETMSWLVYMPRAAVTGQLVIDGNSYTVRAPGYHDHNWGEWIFSNAMWNWAQYSQPGFAFDLGDFIGEPAGVASVEFQGTRTVFTKDQYSLVHTKWALDTANQNWYPIESVFSANNGTVQVVLTMQAVNTDPLRANLPFPLPDVVIYEQTATYTGLIVNKASAQGAVPVAFHGSGFKEYTAKTRTSP